MNRLVWNYCGPLSWGLGARLAIIRGRLYLSVDLGPFAFSWRLNRR